MGTLDDFEQESYTMKQYFQSINLAPMGRTELCEEGPESGSELGVPAVTKVWGDEGLSRMGMFVQGAAGRGILSTFVA